MMKKKVFRKAVTMLLSVAMILSITPFMGVGVFASSPDAYEVLRLSFEDNLVDRTGTHTVNYERYTGGSSTTQTPTYTDGVKPGTKAIDFPNSGNYYYLNLGTEADLCPSSFSVSLWINQDNTWGSGEQILVWNKNEYSSNGWYISSNGSNVPLAISLGPGTSSIQPYQVQVQGARTDFFPLNTWVHVGVTYDGLTKECKVYRNGLLQATRVTQGLSATATGVISDSGVRKSIGYNGPNHANGGQATYKMDEFAIYDQVLTQSEIISVYSDNLGTEFDPATLLQADCDDLTILSRIYQDIALPAKGNNGSTITWKSSDETVLSNNGTIMNPNLSEEKAVTLTATLSYGTIQITKEFPITVVPAATAFPDPETDPTLRAWYKMNETSGTVVTNSGRAGAEINGTASNAAGFTVGSGGYDTASNRYITLPRATTLAGVTGDFTITTRVFFRSGSGWSRLFDFGPNNSSNIIFMTADTQQVNMDNANALMPSAADNNVSNANKWRAITVTRKGNVTSIYVNGTLVASGNQTSTANRTPSSGQLYIARSNWSADPYPNMILKDFRIYTRALEADELQAIYAEYRDPSEMIKADSTALTVTETTSTDLTLPATGASGSKITWESYDESVMLSNGKIANPNMTAEKTVVLKATLTYGSLTLTKYFVVTVVPNIKYQLDDSGLDTVALSDPWLVNARQKDIDYSLFLDVNKLLYFYEYYCIGTTETTASEPYDGWERGPAGFPGGNAQNFRGFTLGRLMAALSQQYISSKDDPETHAKLLDQIKLCINGLKRCQDAYAAANPEKAGYLAPFAESRLDRLRDSGTNSDPLVPFWILDSMLTGIVDIANFVKDDPIGQTAAEVAAKFGEYLYSYTSAWTTAQRNRVIGVEYGGMNIALYMLYDLTGNINDRKTAEIFDEISLFDPLAAEQDVLSGKHANTQIPKFVGAMKRYAVITRNPEYYNALTETEKEELETKYLAAAKGFWNVVTRNHSYVTGGNSQGEHFRNPNSQAQYYTSNSTCETCNTYNMLRLTRELFKVTKDKKYLDFYENTFTNAILSSQNPEDGMFMYFQPMSYGYRKVFSTPTGRFWCCVGTGMDSFSKLNDSLYFTDDDSVYVNMYYSSEFKFAAKNLKLSQVANMPTSDVVTFTVDSIDGGAVADGTDIYFRLPDWCDGSPTVKLNGNVVDPTIVGGFIWFMDVQKGDVIELTYPMKVVLYSFPTNRNIAAFKYGPVVLSTSYGTSNMTATSPNGILVLVSTQDTSYGDSITITDGTIADWKANIVNNLVRIEDSADGQVQFKLIGTNRDSFTYTPHYRRYAERYGLYIPLAGTAGEYAGTAQSISVSEQELTVSPGQKKNITVTVTFADGTQRDVTSLATYKTLDASVCTAANGVVEGIKGGNGIVVVSYSGLNGGTVTIPLLVTVPSAVTFTGADGESLTGLTSTELNVSLPYYNNAGSDANLTMFVAVYAANGQLLHVKSVSNAVASDESKDFKVTVNLPDNIDGAYAAQGCYASVFLWDSASYVPVAEKITAFK